MSAPETSEATGQTESKPMCFAIMPITTPPELVPRYSDEVDHFIRVADNIFKPAAELAGYDFVAPKVVGSEVIQASIIRNLEQADLVICDMSLWNANVFFELGIRCALNKRVAMVKDTYTKAIPFDNTPVGCHDYDWRMQPWHLEQEIPRLTKHLEKSGTLDGNELWKVFGLRNSALFGTPENSIEAKLNYLIGLVEPQYAAPARPSGRSNSIDPDALTALEAEVSQIGSSYEARLRFKGVEDGMFLIHADKPPTRGVVRALIYAIDKIEHPAFINYFNVAEDHRSIFRTDDGLYN